MGDNSAAGGHYIYSSPLVYRGYAYIGVASLCDSPLVQGEFFQVDLASRTIHREWKVVPNGQLGGGIWTNPVIDLATRTIYVTTGNGMGPGERYAQAVVALDASTLALKGYWSLPVSRRVEDSDWGDSPTLFSDARGHALVAAVNKNGILYAFRRNKLNAGPIWHTRLAEGGPCPPCGDGSISTGLFDGHRLYFAGGRTTIRGRSYSGAIRAVDPSSGHVMWARGLPSPVFAALAARTRMVVVADSDGSLYVLSAASGRVMYENHLKGAPGGPAIIGSPTIADGMLVIGTTDGVVHTFKLPMAPAR